MKAMTPTLKMTSLLLAAGVLAGCASQPDYSCDIPDACAPVHDNYEQAVNDEDLEGWVSDGADPQLPEEAERREREKREAKRREREGWFFGLFGGESDDASIEDRPVIQGETDVHDGAVYIPPRPHRIWLGHWKGESGELNSGNYTYLTTPGYYLYMGEKYLALPYGVDSKADTAAGLSGMPRATFSPIRPDQLGFRAEESDVPKGVLDSMVQPSNGE